MWGAIYLYLHTIHHISGSREPRTFCISVAGFKPSGSLSDTLFLPSYSTPTVHVLGKTDVIVVEEKSKTLIDVSKNARVEYHDGGTYIQSLFPVCF